MPDSHLRTSALGCWALPKRKGDIGGVGGVGDIGGVGGVGGVGPVCGEIEDWRSACADPPTLVFCAEALLVSSCS